MREPVPVTPVRDPEVVRAQNRVQADRVTTPQNLRDVEDMSPAAMQERELVRGQLEGQNILSLMRERDANIAATNPNVTQWSSPAASKQAEIAKAIAASVKRRQDQRNGAAIVKYPTLLKAIGTAAAQGADVTAADVVRLVNYAEVDRAAQLYMASTPQGQKNIMLTADPVMRAAILDVVEARSTDFLRTLETSDSNMLVDALGTTVGRVLEPFVWLNETAQHTYRALAYDQYGKSVPDQIAGGSMFGGDSWSWLTNFKTNWDKTERGDFDETYIETLKASGNYSVAAVDFMYEIAKAQASGDPDPIFSALAMFPDNPEVDDVARSLIYRDAEDPQLMELARQIDSANLGSTGQLMTTLTGPGAVNTEFSELRGSRSREVQANSADVFYTFTLDPTLAAGSVVKATRAARYALSKLAPGVGSATKALKSTKVAGVEMNATRRYFDSFTADLRTLDKLESQGKRVKAAALRQQMERQYLELPTEVVEEFRTSGVRTTDDLATFIDDTNDAFLIARGEPARAAEVATGSIFDEVPFFERLYGGGDTMTREALMPRMYTPRVMRKNAVRAISSVMPANRGKAVVNQFYGTGTTDEIVRALDSDNVLQIGRADQAVAGDGFMGRRVDGLTRLFASLPNKGVIYTGDARDARTFYKFARSFLTKRHADVLTDAFRDATPGQRRLMVAGVIRTAAGARGVRLSKHDVLAKIDNMATGSVDGELYSAGRTVTTGADDVEDSFIYRPSSVDGHEHALHLWQTADAVRIPSMREIEEIKAYRDVIPGWLQAAPQRVTDAWSLGTLYGLRFAMRSAIEDIWGYLATAGSAPMLFSGRRASTALRDAKPTVTIKTQKARRNGKMVDEPLLDDDGNVQLVVNSRLGMFAKRARKVGDKFEGADSSVGRLMQMFFLSNFDAETVFRAQEAAKAGNWVPMRQLIAESSGRLRLSGLDDQAISDLQDLAATGFGLKQLDEIAEIGHFAQSGMYPSLVDDAIDGVDVAGVQIAPDAKTAFGDFIAVADGAKNPYYTLFWYRNLEGVLAHDGVIGKLAVAHLEDRGKAIQLVADAIKNDEVYDYANRFSALYTGSMSVDEFAARYVDDVYTMFSGADGTLNMGLLNKVAPRDDVLGGRVVSLFDEIDGEKVARISPKSLSLYRKGGAPEYVLGRDVIPYPKNEAMLFDKAWNWMGEQYARIAREPVFLANYREQRNMLRPYERALSDRIGPEAAAAHTARMASDRAYGFTLNYVDNAANRSQLAWKVRNLSRYYRATEDFYRRAWRMGKNYPEGFWKTALTYQVMSDTGFIFTDDNGDKYFAYPGNEMLQSVVTGIIQPMLGTENLQIDPFFLGGKVKMLAPSSDPNQLFPTVMGPLAVMSSNFIFDRFPQIAGLERYVVGEYGVDASWYDTLIPASVGRALRMMNPDERESMYGNAVMDAFAVAVAEGLIPEVDSAGNVISTPEQVYALPQWQAIERIAWGHVITRGLLGYFAPASPQAYTDNITDYARSHGLDSLRDGFLDLLGQNNGDMAETMRAWWRLNPDGDLMPFTVSKSENTADIRNMAEPQAVEGLHRWYVDNKPLVEKYPNVALFLAPREGEFAWGSYGIINSTLGLRQEKDFDSFVQQAMNQEALQSFYATIEDYDTDLSALDPATQADQIKQLEAEKKADLDWLKSTNPGLEQTLAANQNWSLKDAYAQTTYEQTRTMVNELWDSGKNTPASDAIMTAIATYEDYMTDIKSITGSTNAEDAQKRLWREQMDRDLAAVAESNPNAKVFIENVLSRTPDMVRMG